MSAFTPFPEPVHRDDVPLVRHAGAEYVCTGCGARIPAGTWIFATVRDGMVVGLRMTEGSDGPVIHECGEAAGHV